MHELEGYKYSLIDDDDIANLEIVSNLRRRMTQYRRAPTAATVWADGWLPPAATTCERHHVLLCAGIFIDKRKNETTAGTSLPETGSGKY